MAISPLKAIGINGSLAASQNTSTDETTLASVTIPAGSFSATGSAIHVIAWGTVANNASAKTLTLYFGAGTQAFVLKASVATAWHLDAWIFETNGNTQKGIATLTHGVIAAAQQDNFALSFTEETSNNITVKTTGTGGATADILQTGMVVLT